ncbi:MAG: hypothetical protein ABFD00_04900 [Chloroherpetonaceae bacterium]|nr:hypothetical protein [bacterium]
MFSVIAKAGKQSNQSIRSTGAPFVLSGDHALQEYGIPWLVCDYLEIILVIFMVIF